MSKKTSPKNTNQAKVKMRRESRVSASTGYPANGFDTMDAAEAHGKDYMVKRTYFDRKTGTVLIRLGNSAHAVALAVSGDKAHCHLRVVHRDGRYHWGTDVLGGITHGAIFANEWSMNMFARFVEKGERTPGSEQLVRNLLGVITGNLAYRARDENYWFVACLDPAAPDDVIATVLESADMETRVVAAARVVEGGFNISLMTKAQAVLATLA